MTTPVIKEPEPCEVCPHDNPRGTCPEYGYPTEACFHDTPIRNALKKERAKRLEEAKAHDKKVKALSAKAPPRDLGRI